MNVQGLFAGRTDTPLTEKGRNQALAAGAAVKGIEIDLIIASPLVRASETARLFTTGADLPLELIEYSDLLLERNFGSLEGTEYSRAKSASLSDDTNLPPGVEPWSDLLKRARQLLDYLESCEEKNVLLVGHGSIGRALRYEIDKTSDIHAGIPNAELVRWI
jgi:broad specificity phosphatase PhoE